MARVRGIGGVFFKSENPDALRAWYAKHLGIESDNHGTMFPWRDPAGTVREDLTAWCIFPATTKYFEPSKAAFMFNYIVDNLDGLLEELRSEGVKVDNRIEEYDYGKFGWIMDPEGNRIELWEPKHGSHVHTGK